MIVLLDRIPFSTSPLDLQAPHSMKIRLWLRFSVVAVGAAVCLTLVAACAAEGPVETDSPGATPSQPVLNDSKTRQADEMVMVYVPSGTLSMGSNQQQVDYARTLCDQHPDSYGKCNTETFELETPQHDVILGGFWIDQTEVTNAQYEICVSSGSCSPSRLKDDLEFNGSDYPAAGIPWLQAAEYCDWAGGRLPSEAEWEYAARGSDGHIFPWGDEFDCQKGNFWEACTPCDDGFSSPSPVGSFPEGASWVGATDMAGNVWEWVADEYDESTIGYGVISDSPASGDWRILRGGSWGYCPAFLRSAYRYQVKSEADYLAVGFRCVVPQN